MIMAKVTGEEFCRVWVDEIVAAGIGNEQGSVFGEAAAVLLQYCTEVHIDQHETEWLLLIVKHGNNGALHECVGNLDASSITLQAWLGQIDFAGSDAESRPDNLLASPLQSAFWRALDPIA